MIFGKIQFITNIDESTEAMQSMLDKYVPGRKLGSGQYSKKPCSKASLQLHPLHLHL